MHAIHLGLRSLGPGLVLGGSYGTGQSGPSFVGEIPFGFLSATGALLAAIAGCQTKTFYPNIFYLVFINPDLNK